MPIRFILSLFGNRWMNKLALASLGDLTLDRNIRSAAGLLKPELRQGEPSQTNPASVESCFTKLKVTYTSTVPCVKRFSAS